MRSRDESAECDMQAPGAAKPEVQTYIKISAVSDHGTTEIESGIYALDKPMVMIRGYISSVSAPHNSSSTFYMPTEEFEEAAALWLSHHGYYVERQK